MQNFGIQAPSQNKWGRHVTFVHKNPADWMFVACSGPAKDFEVQLNFVVAMPPHILNLAIDSATVF